MMKAELSSQAARFGLLNVNIPTQPSVFALLGSTFPYNRCNAKRSAMIACITIIAKENNPILLRVFANTSDESKFQYISYCAVDLLEEKERNLPAPTPEMKQEERDRVLGLRRSGMFLGLLYPVEDFKVFGYVISTGVRLVLIVDENDRQDESMVVAMFKKIQALYTDCASNPFYKAGQPLTYPKLDRDLKDLVRLWNDGRFAAK